ncbi:carboxypeptidase regulatory-like domain-containing protein [Clostridium sp. CX1]|uniref:SdrD B-like domain-containing protein n=1 Tax=Clostridium sp. CX1 TaxID=2978346 RepID=UPI0021C111DD|nr:SdrD B-like domain-containing protein [Clostridium sp. CX1]MCT8978548.1 carboxypeptidase regulatory-like domain-containing protein [Clostridium sp. CX1]
MIRLRKNRLLVFFTLLSFIFNIFSVAMESKVKAAENDSSFDVQCIVDKSEVYIGDEFTYTIKYRYANTTTAAAFVAITDELPENVKYISSITSPDIESVTTGASISGRDVITFNFKEVNGIPGYLKDGTTGFVKITAKFQEGTPLATDSYKAENFATIKGSIDGTEKEITSNIVTVTPKVNKPDWKVTKTRVIPSGVEPAVGYPVTYRIDVIGNSKIGGLNLENVTLVDSIPEGAKYISSSDDGKYDEESRKVTWDIGDLPVGTSQSRTITLIYSRSVSSVTNTAQASGNLLGSNEVITQSGEAQHGFTKPTMSVGDFSKYGRQADDRYSAGQTAKFWIGGIENTGNISIDKIQIVDDISEDLELKSVSTGAYSGKGTVEVQYKITKNTTGSGIESGNTTETPNQSENGDWITWAETPVDADTNKVLNVNNDMKLEPGDKISVRWVITNVSNDPEALQGIEAGFKNTTPIAIEAKVKQPASGNTITNIATLKASKKDLTDIVKSSRKTISVIAPMPWLVPEKTVKNGQVKFNMNDTVEYNLTIKNHQFATGDYVNPIAIDVLPEEMEDVKFLAWDKGNTSITRGAEPDTIEPRTIDGKNCQILRWNIAGTLKPGEYVKIRFTAKIKDKTLAGKVKNNFYITTNDSSEFENSPSELIKDAGNLDGDSSTSDNLILVSRDIFVSFVGSVKSEKLVKGELDDNWNKYDETKRHGYTLPGGIADYRLKIKNTDANGPISNLVFIDILPYVGDKGVIDTKNRESEWRPYLVNKITGEDNGPIRIKGKNGEKDISKSVKIYYNTKENPSTLELTDSINNKKLSDGGWSETPPSDITTVKSLKFDFGDIKLQSDEEITLEWPMRAPYAAPTGKIAWGSFGYGATYPDVNGQEPFLPSEPKKVGFEVQPDPNEKYYIGDRVWEDKNKDGIQNDGDTGINGVLVRLHKYNNVISDYEYTGKYTRTGYSYVTGETGHPGYYEFPNLSPGKYKVQFVFPKDYKVTLYKKGADIGLDSNIDKGASGGNITDYEDNGTTKSSIMSDEIVIVDKNDFSSDAGLYRLASIGDKVWNDKNMNGIQDLDESGIKGVVVNLLQVNPLNGEITQAQYEDGRAVPPYVTDEKGNYNFTGLEPGTYKVQFTNPNGDYKFTKADVVSSDKDIDANDSDAVVSSDGLTATSSAITLDSAGSDMTIDAGMYLAQIGDTVWHDKNANGTQDETNAGISGVEVSLLNEDGADAEDVHGNNVPKATTNSSGEYLFDNLKPGKYIVKFEKPTGYDKFSEKDAEGNVTDITKDSNIDSDADKTTGKTSVITLSAGERNMDIDAGLYKLASVGDFIWDDKNANGIQDEANIQGVKGVEVKLLSKSKDNSISEAKHDDGTTVSAITTETDGEYLFDKLKPGIYIVQFTNKNSSFKFSDRQQGEKDAEDSDAVVGADESVATAEIVLNSEDNNITIDAGLHKALIGNKVWLDVNGNGVQDAKEEGIAGVKVELLDKDGNAVKVGGNPLTSITDSKEDSKGIYEFNDLEAGDYKVKFTLPEGYNFTRLNTTSAAIDSDADFATGITRTINLLAGQIDKSWDAGIYVPARLGDFVWLDKNSLDKDTKGIQDAGEPGIEGVTVKLLDKDSKPAKYGDGTVIPDAVTDSQGKYSFTNLVPGAYIVQFQKASYYNYTEKDKGNDIGDSDNTDSDADTATGKSKVVVLKSGDRNDSIDAGYTLTTGMSLAKDVYLGHDEGKGVGLDSVKGEEGTAITYLFTVKNTGTSYLNNLDIIDNELHINKSSMKQVSGKEPIAPGETAVYYYETTINNDLTNTATASAYPSDDKGSLIPNGDKVFSQQGTAVIGELISSMKVEKTVYAGHDKGNQSGGELVVGEGGIDITYVFKITNTGNVHLKDIAIKDLNIKDNGVEIDKSKMIYKGRSKIGEDKDVPLGLNESITYYYETTINGDLKNTVKVVGIPSNELGKDISYVSKAEATDDAKVDEVKPSISVEKTVYNGHDSGKGTGVEVVSGKINTDVTYLFTVKNTGDTILDDITIDDTALGIDKTKLTKLSGTEPLTTGAAIVYYYEGKINGNLINTVQVSGKPVDDKGDAVPNTHNPQAKDTAEVKLSASLGDYIWADTNINGKQDPEEKGIPKVKVILTDSKGNTKSTVTDDNGKYLFDDLMPGPYTVTIDRTTIPAGMAASYELDITLDNKVNVTLSSNQFKDDVDFGYYTPSSGGGVPIVYKLASVGDYVWYDKNGDGKQGLTEKGIPKVVLTLKDKNGRTATATTDDNGKYLFEKLMPGTYTIALDPNTLPEGFKETWELDNSLNEEVSVTLAYNDVKEDVDFGYNKSGINIDDDKIPGGPSENPPDKPAPEDKPGIDIEDDKTPGSPADTPTDKGTKPPKDTKNLGDSSLPKTGTENFNLLLLGIVSLTGSGLFILRRRRRDK